MMQCPFCFSFLKKDICQFHVSFRCDNEMCMMSGEMPRFIEKYDIDFPLSLEYLISRTFCLNEDYVTIDFKAKTTIIYKLDVVLLIDPLQFNQIVDFDLKNLESVKNKLSIIMTFS